MCGFRRLFLVSLFLLAIALTLAATPFSAVGAPVVSAATSSPDAWQTIMTEGFEGAFPGPLWSVRDANGGDEQYWGPTTALPFEGQRSAWPAAAGADAFDPANGDFYPANMDAWMVYGPFDLSAALDAKVVFQLWRDTEEYFDYLSFGASSDGVGFATLKWSGTADWQEVTLMLTDYVDDPTVWIGWHFHSDGTDQAAGVFVDNVILSKQISAAPSAPIVSGELTNQNKDVTLTWLPFSGGTQFEVWRAVNDPYFTPGTTCTPAASCTLVTKLTYTDAGAAGDVGFDDSYAVIAVNAEGRSNPGNRVGEFDFTLVPGG